MTYTVEDVLSWGPCWLEDYEDGEERVRAALSEREHWTPLQFLDLPISAEDRIWLVTHCASDRVLRLFACDCADAALGLIESPDPRSVEAVSVARRYAVGAATAAELSAAWDAAWDVAGDAAGVAWSAAGVAWSAAGADAGDAAWDASWGAARAAAEAAWDEQIKMLRARLEGEA